VQALEEEFAAEFEELSTSLSDVDSGNTPAAAASAAAGCEQ